MANKYIQQYATEAEYNTASKPSPNVSLVYGTDKLYYNGDEHQLPTDYTTKYLTFVALEDGTFSHSNRYWNIYYSLDSGSTWTQLPRNTQTPTVASGSTIMWKGSHPSYNDPSFSSTGLINVQGNALSMVYGDDFVGKTSLLNNDQFKGMFGGLKIVSAENLILLAANTQNCYQNAFAGCTTMTTPPKLPATTLAQSCYGNMFASCTSLATAPELPATTLATHCYWRMFYGCTSLTTAPELPATTLVNSCYQYMFSGCTSLNSITCLATNISATSYTNNWVDGVASSGTFTKAASMTNWPSGGSGIPSGWAVQDYQGN